MSTLFCVFTIVCLYGQRQHFDEQALFVNGEDGYACYRIPAIVKANNGDLLAFAEGRVYGCNDFGDVDIVLKVSRDNGESWSALKMIVDNGQLQSGNPAPLLDRYDQKYSEGRLFLFYNNGLASEHETRLGNGMRTVHYITSMDHGETWSSPSDITEQVHKPHRPDINKKYNHKEDWRSYALTPGHAIQLKKGPYSSRLLVPANHSEGSSQKKFNDYRAHAFYSDDHGQSWQLSESVQIPSSNESIAVELSDGRVMQNIREQSGAQKVRLVAISGDGGKSWEETYFDSTLITPVCQASIIDHTLDNGQKVILFSNPASQTKREKMTIRMSFDDGKSWPVKRLIRGGESAYSDLVIQENSLIGLLYEHGNDGGIHYARMNLEWLLGEQNQEAWVSKMIKPSHVQSAKVSLSKSIPIYESSLFSESMRVDFVLDYPNTEIFYSTDGSDPDKNAKLLDGALLITNSSTIKVRAFHPDIMPSEITQVEFLKTESTVVKEVKVTPEPSKKYAGKGAQTLFDMKKGSLSFTDGNWLGFNTEEIEINVTLAESRQVNEVKLSLLSAHGSWIFLPHKITVEVNGKQESKEIDVPQRYETSSFHFESIKLKDIRAKDFKITIDPLENIPEWHEGKGGKPWLFIDEIIVN